MYKILLALLIASSALAQQRSCSKNCEDCDFNYKCHLCLKSKLNNNKCVASQNTGRCLLFAEGNRCAICDIGYALKIRPRFNKEGLEQQQVVCVPLTIDKCQVGFQLATASKGLAQQKKAQYCSACLGGYPTVGNKACGGFRQTGLEQQVNHCLWGSRNPRNNQTLCYRCKDGYAALNTTGKCVKAAQPGCLSQNAAGKCLICDFAEGYYFKKPFQCTK